MKQQDIRKLAMSIPTEDRPISKKKLSGIGNFFGLYGGEHIAATEFVIGATLVTLGVKASDIFIGLIIGNILATLTFTLLCAPIAVDTRLTLYSYLKKIAGPYMQKVYNVVWGLASIAMAAAMLTVSASAVREIFGVAAQTEWYPTSITFVFIVIALGIIVTLVAANGFEAVAKFSSICAPWLIVVFFAGAVVSLPQLVEITGFSQVSSLSEFLDLANTSIWNGQIVDGGQQLSIAHVIGFAWMCNLAYHGGLNDMALFRYAKSYKYGLVSSVGMFVGHFFAWISAGIMGATAAIVLGQSLNTLDSGAVTNVVLGGMGLCAVIVAGWTTANPNIYRASLALQTVFSNLNIKKLTYLVGALMTFAACFPITSNIMVIVNIIVLIVPSIGAIVLTEHWIFPKIGYTRYWSTYKKMKINTAALAAWGIALAFVAVCTTTNLMHSYFLWLPTYILASVSYIIFAGMLGAKGDYSKEASLDNKVQSELERIIDEEADAELSNEIATTSTGFNICKVLNLLSYGILGVIAILSVLVFNDSLMIAAYKTYAFVLTLAYFAFAGSSVYLKTKGTSSSKAKA
ncbi:MAG: purine-cytosine permease family protein [Peptostreptococcaceae bacterium]